MKICILISGTSLKQILREGFEKNGHNVETIDYQNFRSEWKNKLDARTSWVPERIRSLWKSNFLHEINTKYVDFINEIKPDITLVYNNQELLPDTLPKLKKITRVGFYLADSPFYSHTNRYSIALLGNADFIISPDSFWIEQLALLGYQNLIHDLPGYSIQNNFRISPSKKELETFGNDLVFLGAIYKNSWGYKRCYFLNQFSSLDIKIYSDTGWYKWRHVFPDLEDKIVIKPFFTDQQVNTILNCCKLYPIDANPGLLNGLHIRVLDCIGSGILPIVEYRKDLSFFFKEIEIPIIHNYSQACDLASLYLEDDQRRETILNELTRHVNSRYLPEKFVQRLLSRLET